jgi:hypothetical protein
MKVSYDSLKIGDLLKVSYFGSKNHKSYTYVIEVTGFKGDNADMVNVKYHRTLYAIKDTWHGDIRQPQKMYHRNNFGFDSHYIFEYLGPKEDYPEYLV